MTVVAVFGVGAVGAKIPALASAEEIILVSRNPKERPLPGFRPSPHGPRIRWAQAGSIPECDVGIVALPRGYHASIARSLLRAGADVISTTDSISEVRALLALNEEAIERKRRVIVGAGFAPGLTCLLANHAAGSFDTVTEIHVAKQGTGGPACARQHHAAFKRPAWDFREGSWLRRPGGSGRELVWFPSPIDGADCYRAALTDPLLLVPAFPDVQRVGARVAATRRDRFTGWLPMMRPPHAEGGVGAVRVEVWGTSAGTTSALAFGVADRPAHAAAAVASASVPLARGAAVGGPFGAAGLASWDEAAEVLKRVHGMGLKIETFEGHSSYE